LKLNFNFNIEAAMIPRFRSSLPSFLLSAILVLPGASLGAQSSESPAAEPSIQDNGFLIEEAYNQEAGVVQHISMFTRLWDSKDWAYSFTQEWPLPRRPRHQLSYTAVVTSAGAFPGSGAGFGDSLFNYRFQVLGDGESRVASAPRATLIAPTGASRLGRGYGGFGFQANLPLSLVLSKQFVTHWNLGTTLIPNARNAAGNHAWTSAYNAGQSVIWLAKPRFNVMLETVWSGNEAVVARGQTQRVHTLLVSLGIRWAYNFKSGLQIVPGIAVPIGVGPSQGERGVLLYLSFEHPWPRLYRKK
jgi:Putative MetA-pathway of phenol degradation